MSVKRELTGECFGRLTVMSEDPDKAHGIRWICRCDCGAITRPIRTSSLMNGKTRSCGCLKNEVLRERSLKHGLTNTHIFGVWRTMKARCFNPNSKKYRDYGARGITVCSEWANDFLAFYDWALTHGYEEGLTLDRIDNDRNYCPENCRWVDWTIQANNRRTSPVLVVDGVRHTAREWAAIAGVNYRTILRRYHRGLTGKELIKGGRNHE